MERRSNEEEEFRCKLCDKVYRGDQYLKNHYKRSHGNRKVVAGFYVVCPGCQRKFQNYLQLEKHWKIEHDQLGGDLAFNLMLASIRTRQHLESIERKAPSFHGTATTQHGLEVSSGISAANYLNTLRHTWESDEDKTWNLVGEDGRLSPGKRLECEHKSVNESTPSRSDKLSLENENAKKCSKTCRRKMCDAEERTISSRLQGTLRDKRRRSGDTGERSITRLKRLCEEERTRRWAESAERKERRRQQARIKKMRRSISKRERGLSKRGEASLLAVNGSKQNFEGYRQSNGLASAMAQIKDDSTSRKENKPFATKREVMCYAVVGISSEKEHQEFSDLIVNSGYNCVKFINKDSPLVKGLFDADLVARSTELPMDHGVVFDESPSASGIETHPSSTLSSFSLSTLVPTRCSLPNGEKEISSFCPESAKQAIVSEDRLFSYPCKSNDIGREVVGSRKTTRSMKSGSCCVVCRKCFVKDGFRSFSRKCRSNIVLLACLQAQNILDMESASKAYRATRLTSTRLCHEHYMQAASYIGREVERMWGNYPERGFDQVPWNVQDDLLAYLQVYGDYLDERVTLNTDDLACFYSECMMHYCNVGDGNSSRRCSTSIISKQDFLKSSCVEFIGPCSSTGHLEQVDKSLGPVAHEACPTEISAVELLESPTTQDEIPQNAVVLMSSAFGTHKEVSPPLLPGKTGQSKLGPSKLMDPPPIIRDKSTCLDTLDDEEFRNRFRFTRQTFAILCQILDTWLHSTPKTYLSKRLRNVTCSTGIKVAMVLEMLAGNAIPTAGGPILQKSASQIFCGVMEAVALWSATMIHWPDETESKRISESFFEMTGLSDIVGCLDATIVKGKQPLNVGLVSDDRMRFRWVFAKFHEDAEDEMVFKQSLLYHQLRDGRRKGRLVGDDAFTSELFLMTPSTGNHEMEEESLSLANTLYKAHLTVQQAITNWKTQFPILIGNQKSGKTARIVVCCAALYNLARRENEPVFAAKGKVPTK